MLKKTTRISIGAIGSIIVASSIASAIIVPLAKQKKYEIQYFENGGNIQSLNYVTRGGTGLSSIYGFFMEGLVKAQTPQATVIANTVSLNKRKWVTDYTQGGQVKIKASDIKTDTSVKLFRSQEPNLSFDKKTGDPLFANFENEGAGEKLSGGNGGFYDIAMADIIEHYSYLESPSLRARISDNAFWQNGDKVTAEDFVQTIKYILDKKTASIIQQQTYEIFKLRGVKEIIELQNKGKTFDEAWNKVKDDGKLPVSVDGEDNKWVHYYFEKGAPSVNYLADYLGGNIFMPTNKKFIDSIGGILKFGQTKNTVLANGPYIPDQLDLDYMISFVRNPYYYEKEAVLIDYPAYKISPSQAIQMQLFKDGKLSNIDIPQPFLQSFYSDPKLAALVTHGATSPTTSGILFSKYFADQHPNSDSANKYFRKAIMYGVNRNIYAKYKNSSGSAPANTIYTSRNQGISDENGNTYYNFMKEKTYFEKDPITNAKIKIPFLNYDQQTQNWAFYSIQHNNEYNDYLYQKNLANHFLEKYFKLSKKSSATLDILITASQENQYLAFKYSIEDIFGNKIKIRPKLVSTQVMQEKVYSGDYQIMFSGIATSGSDPWSVYSSFILEDGYNEQNNNKPYIDEANNPSMEATARYHLNPGFELRDYIKTLNASDLTRLNITENDIKGYEEGAINNGITTPGHPPLYKYSIQETIVQSKQPDGMMKFPEGSSVPRALSPHIAKNPANQGKWLFKNISDLFNWYVKTESLLRDSAYFIPLLSSSTSFFADRRGMRNPGNSQALPYGYQFIYPKDNSNLIDKIEADIQKRLGISIKLERI